MSLGKVSDFFGKSFEVEMDEGERGILRFKSFRLDAAERQLRRADEVIPLAPKAFDTLVYLVKNCGHLVTKDELMSAIWPDSFVEEVNLPRTIFTLRKALGEDNNGNKFIQTVPTKGYRFVAGVDDEPIASNVETRPDDTEEQADKPELLVPVHATTGRGHAVRNLTVAAAALAAAVVIGWFLIDPGVFAGGKTIRSRSIAVLPVRPLTETNGEPSFELGIADALIARLSPTRDLAVRQIDGVKAYVGVNKDLLEVGSEQKVDYVLVSNYQIVDGRIRVTFQLFNVATEKVEQVFKLDEDGSDALAVQDAVATRIGNQVLERLGYQTNESGPKRYTTNSEAYSLYMRGLTLADSRDQNAIPKAIEYFEQAVKLDPGYALAYTGLANAHTALSIQGEDSDATEYRKAHAAIEKALQLDETLSEAHTYLAELKWGKEWDFAGAEREFKRGIELNPNSSAAHRMYGLMLGLLGRTDEAAAEFRTAIDLEPASVLNHKLFGKILYHGRRFDDAIVEAKLAFEMSPNQVFTYDDLIDAYVQKGEYDLAFEWFVRFREVAGDDAERMDRWKTAYSAAGWNGVRRLEIELIKSGEFGTKSGSFPPMSLARLYAMQGETDRAFEYIERAFERRQWGMVKLRTDPALDPLRADPRFDDLLRRGNLK